MDRTVLVAEDSRTQAEHLRLLLEGEGYRVSVVPDGREGLDHARTAAPDLIISDVVMPGLDGYGFCRAVKSVELTRRIPFVLLTERNAPGDVIRGLQAGADNFITKPFQDEYLLERVGRIFQNLEMRRQGRLDVEITLSVGGQRFVVNADKQQMIELLFATLEELVRVNERLEESQRVAHEYARNLETTQGALVRSARLAALGQLAGGVSHELRNPLGVIRNSIYYLGMVLPADERLQKHCRIMEREIATATRILAGVLDFTQMREPERAPARLARLVETCLEAAKLPDGIAVVRDLPADLPTVLVDPSQMGIAIGKMVTNAIQAMPEGGLLTFAASGVAGGVQLTIADTGTGIAPGHLDRIFEPLFSTRTNGLGLGLAVARKLAELNGAIISVESTPGRGSRFAIQFPADR